MRRVDRNGIRYFVSPLLESCGFRHAFTTRLGGVSEGAYASLNLRIACDDKPENVRKNYEILAETLDFSIENVVMSRQVHSNFVRFVDRGEGLFDPARPDADGLVAADPDLALFVFGADCVTILIADPTTGAAAAVHSGWRGTALGICGDAVRSLAERFGSRTSDLVAAIGPCICKDCFEVGGEVADALCSHFGEISPKILEKRGEKFHADLGALCREELLRAGILPENVEMSGRCTKCEPELFWSHRRTGDARGVQAAVILPGGARC